jgi:hypothetical protein
VDGHILYGSSYPSFVVGMSADVIPGHHDSPSRQVTTCGPPLWSSFSWLGRGTSVWKCTNGRILKVAWRNEAGTSEPGIYHLADSRPGLARRGDGGDVHIITPGHPEVKLDTNFIIARLSRQTEFNAVLQHVVLD